MISMCVWEMIRHENKPLTTVAEVGGNDILT